MVFISMGVVITNSLGFMKIMDLIYGTEGISSCPPESVCPLFSGSTTQPCFLGDLAVKYRLVGRRLLPRNMSRSDGAVAPHVPLLCSISSHLLTGGSRATLGARIEMKKLVAL